MRINHPRNVPPSRVDVNGTHAEVDEDGTFELPDGVSEGWVQRFASAHGVEADEIVVGDESEGSDDEAPPILASEANVDEIEAAIERVESPESIRVILEDEREGKNRTTAVEALESRLDELEE
jgi:hypothetical protein